ncbi:MAG: hypothetical protein RIQ32_773, partial [Actinomycetota bacterium]
SVHNDGATATFALLASTFSARQVKTLAQNIKQAFANPRVAYLVCFTVDSEIINF